MGCLDSIFKIYALEPFFCQKNTKFCSKIGIFKSHQNLLVLLGLTRFFNLSLWLTTNGWIFMPLSIHIPGMAWIFLVKFQAAVCRFCQILANFWPKLVILYPTGNSAKILEIMIL